MITFYSNIECKDFIMTHEMINSDYSPPLERTGGIYIILEKGDIVPFLNEWFIYLGRVIYEKNIPRDLNVLYKTSNEIRYRKNKKNNIIKYIEILKDKKEKKHKEMNSEISEETETYIKTDAMKLKNKELQKERENKIRKKMIEFLGGKCCKCGTTYNLSFVHRNIHDKKYSVSQMIKEGKAIEDIYEEVQKCDLYCKECREKMFKEIYT